MPRAGYRSPWLVFGAVALVALLLYLPTLRYGFVWDDHDLILNNPFLSRANPIQILTGEFWNNPDAERSSQCENQSKDKPRPPGLTSR